MKQNWSYLQKLGFLVLFIYSFLFINTKQFIFSGIFNSIWEVVIPWFAQMVGHETPINTQANGSGDTTYNYYQILFFLFFALLFGVVISFVDKRRINYNTLMNWFIIFIRYYLAFQMILYGFAKFFSLQFVFPGEMRLNQELGDFSPMGLLWNFMGYSKAYTNFTGVLEFVSGILLLSKYTTLLGALTTFGVMLNVMMLNYCYDVPVKILSTHLVLMSLFLVLMNSRRLFLFFIGNKDVAQKVFQEVIPLKYRKHVQVIKWCVIVASIGGFIYFNYNPEKPMRPYDQRPLFYGKYYVEKFERNGPKNDETKITIPEMMDWKYFKMNRNGSADVTTSFHHTSRYLLRADTTDKTIELKLNGAFDYQTLQYELMDSNRVQINGIYLGDTLNILMQKQTSDDRLLVNRKFHWINEYPFNR